MSLILTNWFRVLQLGLIRKIRTWGVGTTWEVWCLKIVGRTQEVGRWVLWFSLLMLLSLTVLGEKRIQDSSLTQIELKLDFRGWKLLLCLISRIYKNLGIMISRFWPVIVEMLWNLIHAFSLRLGEGVAVEICTRYSIFIKWIFYKRIY